MQLHHDFVEVRSHALFFQVIPVASCRHASLALASPGPGLGVLFSEGLAPGHSLHVPCTEAPDP